MYVHIYVCMYACIYVCISTCSCSFCFIAARIMQANNTLLRHVRADKE